MGKGEKGMKANVGKGREKTYIIVSTVSIVMPWCICFMAVVAFFMASSVSLLMLAVSML